MKTSMFKIKSESDVLFSRHWLQGMKCFCFAFAMLMTPALVAQGQNSVGGGKDKVVAEKKVTYKGVVVDEMDMPLPGVSVVPKSVKNRGTTTNVNGEFEITIPEEEHYLVFSYVGMKTQTVRVGGANRVLKICLAADAVALKEAVVTGIYTRNAESFTGSMSTYTEKELKNIGNSNVLQSLKVLDPSFIVLENNLTGSDPNAAMNLNVRGNTNIVGLETEYETNPNQPLFILDGFETSLSTITDLSMDRVESITILKDAASTAIYGSKAANGVVVVETKKPEPGRLRFNYNGNFTVEWADLSDYNLMNSREKLEYEKLAGYYGKLDENGGIIDESFREQYNERLLRSRKGLDSYWLNEPLRTGFTQSHNVFAEGGDAAFRYGIGLTYTQTNGVMKNSDRDVLNGNVQLSYRISKFAFSNQTTISNTDVSNPTVSFSKFARTNPFYNKSVSYTHLTLPTILRV